MDFRDRQEAVRRIVAELERRQVSATVLAVDNGFSAMLANRDISRFESAVRKVLKGYHRTGHESTPTSLLETFYFDGTELTPEDDTPSTP